MGRIFAAFGIPVLLAALVIGGIFAYDWQAKSDLLAEMQALIRPNTAGATNKDAVDRMNGRHSKRVREINNNYTDLADPAQPDSSLGHVSDKRASGRGFRDSLQCSVLCLRKPNSHVSF